MYKKLETALKKNGVFLLEACTPDQLEHPTGGGKSADSMQSKETVSQELPALRFKHMVELGRNVVEGMYHTRIGAVVPIIATT